MHLTYNRKTGKLSQAESYLNEPMGAIKDAVPVEESSVVFSPKTLAETEQKLAAGRTRQKMLADQKRLEKQFKEELKKAQAANNEALMYAEPGPSREEKLIRAEMVRRAKPSADFNRYQEMPAREDFGAADWSRYQIVGNTMVRNLPMTTEYDFAPIVKGPYYNANLGGVWDSITNVLQQTAAQVQEDLPDALAQELLQQAFPGQQSSSTIPQTAMQPTRTTTSTSTVTVPYVGAIPSWAIYGVAGLVGIATLAIVYKAIKK